MNAASNSAVELAASDPSTSSCTKIDASSTALASRSGNSIKETATQGRDSWLQKVSMHELVSQIKKNAQHSTGIALLLYILVLAFICCLTAQSSLYGIGQLYSISYSNFWCDETYTINEIYEINKKNGDSQGSDDSCLATDAIVDYNKLFATDPSDTYASQFDSKNLARDIFFCTCYQITAFLYLVVLLLNVKYICLKFVVPSISSFIRNYCKKNKKDNDQQDEKKQEQERKDKDKENDQKHEKQRERTMKECFCSVCQGRCIDYWFHDYEWYDKICTFRIERCSVDTDAWIFFKLIFEGIEIVLQVWVLFTYGGTSPENIMTGNWNVDSGYISQLPEYVIIFASVVLANGIVTGVFWLVYIFIPHICYGETFKYGLFIVDGLFDTMYSIFPMIISGGLVNSNTIGILQHTSWIQFLATIFPNMILTVKLDIALNKLGKILAGKDVGDAYGKDASDIYHNYNDNINISTKNSLDVNTNQYALTNTSTNQNMNDSAISNPEQLPDPPIENIENIADATLKSTQNSNSYNLNIDNFENKHNSKNNNKNSNNFYSKHSQPLTLAVASGSSQTDSSGDDTGTDCTCPGPDRQISYTESSVARQQLSTNIQMFNPCATESNACDDKKQQNNGESIANTDVYDYDLSHESSTTQSSGSHGVIARIERDGKKLNKQVYIDHRIPGDRARSAENLFSAQEVAEHKQRRKSNSVKRLILGFVACVYVIISILVSLWVIFDTLDAKDYCSSFVSLLDSDIDGDAELLLYNQGCQTKVYQLGSSDPCNCRFFQITSDESDDNNSTICQIHESGIYDIGELITNIFSKWTMLERIWIDSSGESGCFSDYNLYIFDDSFFNTNLQSVYLGYPVFVFDNNTDINTTAELIEESISNWKNVIFFELYTPAIPDGILNNILNGIGNYMTDLIYLSIFKMDEVYTWPNAICNLDGTLEYLYMGTHSIDSVDDCIENFGQLRYFLFSGGTTSYVPLRSLFNLNKIGLISLTSLSISWETAISEFYENDTFVGYNENSIERVYFQLNDLCDDYSNNYNFSELIEMIDEYDACTKSCNTDSGELWCPSSKNGNGVCDSACFSNNCGWDSGDCNQLCNYTACDISSWTDGVCDSSCNSTECEWDGYDCGFYDFDCPTNCTLGWLNDGWCETICLNEENSDCWEYEYDTDCNDCSDSGAYGCYEAYQYFSVITSDDSVITQSEWCALVEFWWDLILEYLNVENGLNCTNIVNNSNYDINMNGEIGFYEFIVMFGSGFDNDGNDNDYDPPNYLYYSIDCSFCLANTSHYYL